MFTCCIILQMYFAPLGATRKYPFQRVAPNGAQSGSFFLFNWDDCNKF